MEPELSPTVGVGVAAFRCTGVPPNEVLVGKLLTEKYTAHRRRKVSITQQQTEWISLACKEAGARPL